MSVSNVSRACGVLLLLVIGLSSATNQGCITWPDWPIPTPVDPDDQDPPGPDEDEDEPQGPIPLPGLYVLIIEEMDNRSQLPESQLQILRDSKWREYVYNKGGQPLVWDQHVNLDKSLPVWKEVMNLPRERLPWVIISDYPDGGTMQPLPSDLEQFNSLLKRWGE